LSVVSQLSGLQKLCLVTCVVLFALIVLGGVVRATDSGDGCPDWPLCHGNVIPKTDKHTLIEYSHRATASVVGLLILSVAVVAWRNYRNVPRIFYPSLVAFGLVLVQGGLGGAAVLNDLAAEIVMIHLGLALTILALVILITTTTFDMRTPIARVASSVTTGRLAILGAAGVMGLMVIGAYVAVADYSLACAGWPLCNGDAVPDLQATSVQVIYGHRILAALVGLILLALAARTWLERPQAPAAFALAAGALLFYAVQVFVGAANIWTEVADEVSTLHLAFGTLLWVMLAMLNIFVHRLYERLPRTAGETPAAGLAGVAR
jgi:heme A synthase